MDSTSERHVSEEEGASQKLEVPSPITPMSAVTVTQQVEHEV